jgi:hypothetical protein
MMARDIDVETRESVCNGVSHDTGVSKADT